MQMENAQERGLVFFPPSSLQIYLCSLFFCPAEVGSTATPSLELILPAGCTLRLQHQQRGPYGSPRTAGCCGRGSESRGVRQPRASRGTAGTPAAAQLSSLHAPVQPPARSWDDSPGRRAALPQPPPHALLPSVGWLSLGLFIRCVLRSVGFLCAVVSMRYVVQEFTCFHS